MKILICTGIFPPDIGGPATYSKLLAEETVKRGHKVKIITYANNAPLPPLKLRGGEEELLIPVIAISRLRLKPWHYLKYFLAVLRHGRKMDILFAQDPVSAGYPTFLANKFLKKPFVLKITGDYSWEQAYNRGLTDKLIDDFQNENFLPIEIKRIRDIQIKVCKTAKKIIVPSQYLKSLVIGWGIDPQKIEVIYNEVPKTTGLDSRLKIREELGYADKEFLVLSIGRVVKWKNFSLVKEVIAEISKENPNVKIKILNDADANTIHRYLIASDVFVLNTGYEGFSHIILEAMDCSLPVVVSRVGGNLEMVKEGQNGLFFEYNNYKQIKDTLLRLIQDPDLRAKLGQGAKQTAENFIANVKKEDGMIIKTEKLLQQCAS